MLRFVRNQSWSMRSFIYNMYKMQKMSSESKKQPPHQPVMKKEILQVMQPEPGQRFLDMTFGAGGHSRALLECQPDLQIFAVDRDPEAFSMATDMSQNCSNLVPLLGRFSDVGDLLRGHGVEEESLDGALFDAGASSMQFDSDSRGFALSRDMPLDMRMDKDRVPDQPTAADIVNTLGVDHLSEVLRVYGQEPAAREIAQAVEEYRQCNGNIETTKQLAKIVSSVASGSHRKNKLKRNAHVATRTFQALRIYVNNELNELHQGLETVHRFLRPGGICAVIVFHSLEERVAKRHFQNRTERDKELESYRKVHRHILDKCSSSNGEDTSGGQTKVYGREKLKWKTLSKFALPVSQEEMYRNPRSRSARIRAAVKR